MLDGLRTGWVHGLKLHNHTGTQQKRFLIKGKVSYIMDPHTIMHFICIFNNLFIYKLCNSQRTSATPLIPWVVTEEDGEVLAAHCNCMAGYVYVCN